MFTGSKMIKNISGIDFEEKPNDEVFVKQLRHGSYGPTVFDQQLLTSYYKDLLNKDQVNVLEIGCGWGRNAQWFKDKININYYGFDTSQTSLRYFNDLQLPKERFYTSLDIDQVILSQKYDLIFSTFVLQHIGFYGGDILDVNGITKSLIPLLNFCGFWFSYELGGGQNSWNVGVWIENCFNNDQYKVKRLDNSKLEGSDKYGLHHLIIVEKIG